MSQGLWNDTTRHTFVIQYTTVFQRENASFAFLHSLKVMANLQALQVLC